MNQTEQLDKEVVAESCQKILLDEIKNFTTAENNVLEFKRHVLSSSVVKKNVILFTYFYYHYTLHQTWYKNIVRLHGCTQHPRGLGKFTFYYNDRFKLVWPFVHLFFLCSTHMSQIFEVLRRNLHPNLF